MEQSPSGRRASSPSDASRHLRGGEAAQNGDPTGPMALQCGIVGLPNVGKSTIFNALTAAGIQAENYPFCTIEPNEGVVEVPDARLAALERSSAPSGCCPPPSNSSTSRAS